MEDLEVQDTDGVIAGTPGSARMLAALGRAITLAMGGERTWLLGHGKRIAAIVPAKDADDSTPEVPRPAALAVALEEMNIENPGWTAWPYRDQASALWGRAMNARGKT